MDFYELQIKIHRFWDWFVENEHRFRKISNAQQVREDLNNQVLEFGLFSWHLEKSLLKKHIFTISPNGDKKLLTVSKHIMRVAPKVSNWTFEYCLPPKKLWNFTFEMYDAFMIKQKFDASRWKYVLMEKRNKHVKILIKADNIVSLEKDEQLQTVRMVIMNILGEEAVMDFVDAMELVSDFPNKQKSYQEPMKALKEHFEEIMEDESSW